MNVIRLLLPYEAVLRSRGDRQNLSPRLVDRLSDLYPESIHVFEVGLDQAQDIEVWEYAKNNDYIIVSKDADFSEIGLFRGFPPKIVWIRKGNCSTNEIENILRRDYKLVEELQKNDEVGVLLLY